MVKLYVGVTDYDWFRFLSALPNLDEVNFWQPGGQTNFKALQPGELFLFKLHSPRNFIVGAGVFMSASILPVSLAWTAFGLGNGADSLEQMKARIAFYRHEPTELRKDYLIGCRILEQPSFLPEERWIPIPASWSPNIVSGRTYDTADGDGRALWDAITDRMAAHPVPGLSEPRYGEPSLIRPRLGQGLFRVTVTDAYGRRCAVTREKTLPILDAAHIRPYAEGGGHDVANGLLLRTDIHRLFDLGYVTISSDGHFEVGRRLQEDFENGRYYYAMHGQAVALPSDARLKPSRATLEWHQNNKFLGQKGRIGIVWDRRGVDLGHPSTGTIESGGPDTIALWMIDTDYNEESFFVRHAYFLGASDPYKALKTTLKAQIDEEAWESLHSDTSRPFDKPKSGRIAAKVTNHLGDEVMKVFSVR